jgi:hypothetical protein
MKTAWLSLAALLVFTAAPTAPADAAESLPAAQTQNTETQDISAARRKYKQRHYRHYSKKYRAPRAYGYGYRWHPGDPNAGPNSLLSFYRRNNICAIDEGYGRATRCN